MATSDTEAAWRRLEVVRTQLQRLARRHHPDDRERQAHSAVLIDDYHNLALRGIPRRARILPSGIR